MKEISVAFAEWIENNGYIKIHSEELKQSAWVDSIKHKILNNGSDYHYTDLINHYGYSTERLWDLFINTPTYKKLASESYIKVIKNG